MEDRIQAHRPASAAQTDPKGEHRFEFQVSQALEDSEWDAFLARTPGGHHVQSSMWARVKAGTRWDTIRLVARQEGQIIGGAQLLIRHMAPLASIVYLSKGPATGVPDLSLTEAIVHKSIEIAKQKKALLFAIQPPNNGIELGANLPQWGFEACDLELAPVASLVLDLSPSLDQLLANMKRQTRQNIRRGEQGGLIVRDGSEVDFDEFYEFHRATSQRQGFEPYAKAYYLDMWRAFRPGGLIKLFIAEIEGKRVTGLLLIPFGDTVIAKILGWSGEHPELRPNDAVFWHAIKWSKESGFQYFDFEGIDKKGAQAVLAGESLPAELQHSPDFFKMGYGGQVVLYPPAFEMIPNPIARRIYKAMSPTVGGETWGSRLMDRLRKR